MIDITQAQANQTTRNGVNGEWIVTLEGEELYRLPEHFSVQETFAVRDIIEQMMDKAVKDALKQEREKHKLNVNKLIINGDAKLDALKRENQRLSTILEQHIGE